MSSALSPENEQFLQEAVALGAYRNRDQALEEAVALLKRRDELLRHIDEGTDQLRRGEGIELHGDAELREFFDDLKSQR